MTLTQKIGLVLVVVAVVGAVIRYGIWNTLLDGAAEDLKRW